MKVTAPRADRERHQNRCNQTKITKFRKTVWGVFVVMHDFDPLDENEIAIRKGEHVSVWNQDDRDWFWVVKHASSSSEEGFVPSSCLREVSADSKTAAPIKCKHNKHVHCLCMTVHFISKCLCTSECYKHSHEIVHAPMDTDLPSPPFLSPPAVDSVRHNSYTTTTTTNSGSPNDIMDPVRHRAHSHESRHPNPIQSRPPRPSSGGVSRNNSRRERRSSESNSQVHRLHNQEPLNLSIKKDGLPPSPPSSPPPPYTEFDTNRRFMSLSQQPTEMHHSQPSGQGYGHGMHRTRSQGYVTSRGRAVHYPSSSTPHGERREEGGVFPNEGTLV